MTLLAIEFDSLHAVLANLYLRMMPLCENMIGVAKGIAGLGALFFISYKVWQSLAKAEPIDVFPLLRPFVIGLCIMFFPTFVLDSVNYVLSPIVVGTHEMLGEQTMDMNEYQKQKDELEREALRRDPRTAFLASNEDFDKKLDELGFSPKDLGIMTNMYLERGIYEMKKSIRNAMRYVLELLFEAASLLIDTLRTFFLIVLSILGPIAFAISVWDGFQSTLTGWFTRYISIYLWLPVSDLFSSMLAMIQKLMLEKDIAALKADPNFSVDASDGVYLIFMLIGIIGYFTVPTVAGWIIQAGGVGSYGRGVNTVAGKGGTAAAAGTGAVVGNLAGRARKMFSSGGN